MRPVINFRGKKYSFSNVGLIIFPLGLIIAVPSLLHFVENVQIIWLQELFAKHVAFFLNLFFNLGAQVIYVLEYLCPWLVTIPDISVCYPPGQCYSITVYMTNGCTGFLAMGIFVAVILFSPHSHDPKTKEDVLWRKSIAIIAAISLVYLYNVFRATIQVYLYSRGFKWSVIHDSEGMLAITVAFHIAIFLLCSKYVPEWFLSIYYSGKLLTNKHIRRQITEFIYDIKHEKENEQYKRIRQLFRNEGLDLYIIKTEEIDLKLLEFLKKNNQKYTIKAIKNHLFNLQENISEDLIEKILNILANIEWVFTEKFDEKIYYFIPE